MHVFLTESRVLLHARDTTTICLSIAAMYVVRAPMNVIFIVDIIFNCGANILGVTLVLCVGL